MGYIGAAPTAVPLTGSDLADGIITSAKISNGTIAEADLADGIITSAKISNGTIAEADMADNAITLAKMAGGTDGNLIGIDASGDPAYIATGSDGEILTSGGAGVAASMEAAAAGGKILQVVYSNDTKQGQSTTSTTESDVLNNSASATWEVAITPSATSSKIMVFASVHTKSAASGTQKKIRLKLKQKIGGGSYGNVGSNDGNEYGMYQGSVSQVSQMVIMNYLSSPSTTSEVKYKVTYRVNYTGYGTTAYVNNNDNGSPLATNMTLMEVAG
jgi:hypothetical protein